MTSRWRNACGFDSDRRRPLDKSSRFKTDKLKIEDDYESDTEW
jgi:hypothetical protein